MPDLYRFGLMCCICFEGLTPETCAVDGNGEKWDVCPGQCAMDAGLVEHREPTNVFVFGLPGG